jgi:hypothetical protein
MASVADVEKLEGNETPHALFEQFIQPMSEPPYGWVLLTAAAMRSSRLLAPCQGMSLPFCGAKA